jgi:hypothetical protein
MTVTHSLANPFHIPLTSWLFIPFSPLRQAVDIEICLHIDSFSPISSNVQTFFFHPSAIGIQ